MAMCLTMKTYALAVSIFSDEKNQDITYALCSLSRRPGMVRHPNQLVIVLLQSKSQWNIFTISSDNRNTNGTWRPILQLLDPLAIHSRK